MLVIMLINHGFLSLYNQGNVETIGLDDAATRLGVERRRIYDIVNVLESVGVLARKAKNRYSWKGFGGVPKTLQQLREEGLRENFNTFNGNNYVKVSDDDEDEKISNPITSQNDKPNPSSVTKSSTASKTDNRKEKSLGLLTQNFVKLFLCSNEAAKILLGDAHDPSMMRTKVRRLYDIANVLSSMNFIEKTHHPESRKSAFRWLGTRGKSDNGSAYSSVLNESNKRIFGTEITNTSFKRTKVDLENEVDKSNFEQDLRHSSKNFQFGPFAPVTVSVSKFGATQNSTVKQGHDLESLASTYRPQYHNQGIFPLRDLFVHYVEAWKSWCSEVAGRTRYN
ncbi:E2F transcription factor-like E2FE [Camellia lanceoleosa]|uniref:E2F transcription factor-like E2FE n=1 Tax=Camellia lanceoleosa TaxID=1840588 RepID=A0ACC0FCJ8_9ERIC|nr:E2F transcription factor-like E2FE [Camellia lanceoleosa]